MVGVLVAEVDGMDTTSLASPACVGSTTGDETTAGCGVVALIQRSSLRTRQD
jgi:hypothetical protein